jgi:hypothetical protein
MPAQDFQLAEDCPANPVARHSKDAANDSPSPGGEGRGEDGRSNHPCSNSKIHAAGLLPVSARRNRQWPKSTAAGSGQRVRKRC